MKSSLKLTPRSKDQTRVDIVLYAKSLNGRSKRTTTSQFSQSSIYFFWVEILPQAKIPRSYQKSKLSKPRSSYLQKTEIAPEPDISTNFSSVNSPSSLAKDQKSEENTSDSASFNRLSWNPNSTYPSLRLERVQKVELNKPKYGRVADCSPHSTSPNMAAVKEPPFR